MNWLDIVMIVVIAIGSLVGWRIRVTQAVFMVVGLVLGIYLAAQLSGDVAELLTDTISSTTMATVIAYVLIIAVVMVAAKVLQVFTRKVLSLLLLGWADALGGLALGFVGGAIVASALIIGLARYSYNFELTEVGIPGQIVSQIERLEVKEGVQKALTGSAIVPAFLDIRDSLPGDTLGFLPTDFSVALDILEEAIEGEGASG